jgi:methyl-accepting chemotaxis protein
MSIRSKLIANVLVVTIIIALLSLSSYLGMRFLRDKLSYLTEKSTPFQLHTVEFQRAIQVLTSDLLKVTSATTTAQYATLRADADASLNAMKTAQQKLEAISGEKLRVDEEMATISTSLLQAVQNRLSAEDEARKSGSLSQQKLTEVAQRLTDLDKKIKMLQMSKTSRYLAAVGDKDSAASKSTAFDGVRGKLKDLHLAVVNTQKGSGKQDPVKLLNALLTDSTVRGNAKIRGDLKALQGKMEELNKGKTAETADQIAEKIDQVLVQLDAEALKAKEKLTTLSESLEASFTQANISTTAIMSNSEIVSLGLSVKGLVTRLFTVNSAKEIDGILAELSGMYEKIGKSEAALQNSLQKMQATAEIKILKGAIGSLQSIKQLAFSNDGIAAKLKHHLAMQEQALQETEKLRKIVLAQAEKGKQAVSSAQGDQEKSIVAVNQMIQKSTTLIAVVGIASILIGILFGFWIYRSIAAPMAALIETAHRIASGYLTSNSHHLRNDEIGVVQKAMAEMVTSLSLIAGKIGGATNALADNSAQLSDTATAISSGTNEQAARIEQSATAIMEMSQTIATVSLSTHETANAAGKMKQTASQGKLKMHGAVQELCTFAETVKASAQKVATLGEKSQEINTIVSLIDDIADQTNLLALNAAIEAARAGDHGRGFAVVAEEVRALAVKSGEATKEINRSIQEMQENVADSVQVIQSESSAVDAVVQIVNHSMSDIDNMVTEIETISDMIQQIATATQEQSATADDLTRNINSIAQVAKQLQSSFDNIMKSSQQLSFTAAELNETAKWFKL